MSFAQAAAKSALHGCISKNKRNVHVAIECIKVVGVREEDVWRCVNLHLQQQRGSSNRK